MHGNCPNTNSGTCNGEFTTTAGYEGPWTRTPSTWNYDYFRSMLDGTEWIPAKSPEGNDQWRTKDTSSKWAKTMKLTSDLALVADPEYKELAKKYDKDHSLFDNDFADAWFKLTHRSAAHPNDGDLENDGKCTDFNFTEATIFF